MIPRGIAVAYATIRLILIRISVGPRRWEIISSTGCRSAKENPIFPVRKLAIQSTYWINNGLSSPRAARVISTWAAVISGEIYISAGSPGVRWTRMKAPMDMRNKTGIEISTRFKMYFPIIIPPKYNTCQPVCTRPAVYLKKRAMAHNTMHHCIFLSLNLFRYA